MPGKGYKVLSVKEEVVKKIQDRARAEEGSISKLLDNLLTQSSTNPVKISSKDTVIETIRATIREELKSSTDAVSESSKDTVTEKGEFVLSEADIKKIAGQMELAIGMYIESGVAKGVKELR